MKPIFLSNEDMEEMKKDFFSSLKQSMFDGIFNFSRKYEYKNESKDKAYIYYTPEAFAKMFALIQKYNSEVAWHCLVDRMDEPNKFRIYDVLVYKQIVTGATVNTEQEDYVEFLCGLTEEQANHMHVQCHSHVNMGTSPSTTDTDHQRKILSTMGDHGFYIFQIWNKKFECTSFIYDLDNNVYYENKDIECMIEDSTFGTTDDFIASTKDLVVYKGTTYNTTGYQSNGSNNWYYGKQSYGSATTSPKKDDEPKKKQESWYMGKDPKPKGERDYDEEIFGMCGIDEDCDYYGCKWDSNFIYS